MIVCETERLRLRWATAADGPFFVELLNDPSWLRYIGDRGVNDVAAAIAFIDERLGLSYRENGFGLYLVERRSDDVPVGICGLVRREGMDGPDLGFAFLAQQQRRGYGREAAEATLKYAAKSLGLRRVLAITLPENTASIGLLEAVGMRRLGELYLPGHESEQAYFEIRLS